MARLEEGRKMTWVEVLTVINTVIVMLLVRFSGGVEEKIHKAWSKEMDDSIYKAVDSCWLEKDLSRSYDPDAHRRIDDIDEWSKDVKKMIDGMNDRIDSVEDRAS
jgi:hypothetical protein